MHCGVGDAGWVHYRVRRREKRLEWGAVTGFGLVLQGRTPSIRTDYDIAIIGNVREGQRSSAFD